MLKLVGLAFLVWITATFGAAWIDGLRTGVVSLVGPSFRVRRSTHPIGYIAGMGLLTVPVAVGLIASAFGFKMAFPYQSIPASPAAGYAQASHVVSGQRGYFPTALTRMTYKCAEFPKAVPVLSPDVVDWYSKHLTVAGEPTLLPAPTPSRATNSAYRFIWLRSFDKPVVVRIQEGSNGALFMTASRLSGMGGYEPGKVEARIERELTASEKRWLLRAFAAADRLRLKAVTCGNGNDGAAWIFEALDGGAYRYVDRWSPKTGPVRALGLMMLSFTGWELGPDD